MINKVLIIAPLRVCYTVWPKEIEKWSQFTGLTVEILHGPKKDKALARDADIYLINPEGIDWLLGVKKIRQINGKFKIVVDQGRWGKLGFDLLVVDELSKFKHTGTDRFKALKQVLGSFKRRWGLTGSPASNGLEDLFGQFFIIDQGRSLGQYITQYRLEYFDSDYMGYNWTLKKGAKERIYDRIKPVSLRMSCEDYLEMPELINSVIPVALPDKVRRGYDKLKSALITQIGLETVVATNAADGTNKLRQIANGGVYKRPVVVIDEDFKAPKQPREWLTLHNEKTDALEDLVDELQGAPLLVAYEFEHDLDRLRKRFPKAVFASDYNMKQFKQIELDWNAGKIKLLFGHPASIGHGLNLQGCGNHVCFYSLTWNYEYYDQFIRRVYRQGNQSERVFVYHIVAEDTIDEVVMDAMVSKKATQEDLFQALKTHLGVQDE